MTDARATFASRSDAYAVARPRYPAALYDWIVSQCPNRKSAWDCATGNGQAAVDLAQHFDRVYASDISPEQVAHGQAKSNIVYVSEPAEATSYPDGLFDFVGVAQALHWFDYGRFWPEVRRVAKPSALFCAWGYAWFESDPDIDQRLVVPFREAIGPYWAANNAILWRGYRSEEIAFPFKRLRVPDFSVQFQWDVPQLIAYMQTWSAYKRAKENVEVAARLDSVVGEALRQFEHAGPVTVTMPLATVAALVGRAGAAPCPADLGRPFRK